MHLEFDEDAEQDLIWWKKNDKKKLEKIKTLIRETLLTP